MTRLLFLLITSLYLLFSQAFADTTPTLRVISCAPNLTEIIYAIDAEETLVGVSTYTTYPEEAKSLPAVADLFNPNIEEMLRLDPDLIIALESHQKIIDYFRPRRGVKVITMGELETLAQIDNAILRIGRELGHEKEARTLLDRLPAVEKSPVADPPRVLFVIGYGPGLRQLYAVGHGTYLNELIEAAGAENVVPPDLGKYPTLEKEYLIRRNPEIILMVAAEIEDMESHYQQIRREWSALLTTAVRRGDFRFIKDNGILTPGPRARQYLPVLRELIQNAGPGESR